MPMIQLTEHCWALPFSSEADRPTLGCICGNRRVLGVDAGNSAAHVRLMADEMHRCGLPPINCIALTHSHWDHTYGLHALACPSYATEATQAKLRAMSQWTWTLSAMEQRLRTREDIAFCHDCILIEYPDLSQIRVTPASQCFTGSLTLDLGGVTAQLLQWPNSHDDDHAVVYIPEDKVIYLGDICYTDLHHDPECLHLTRFRQLIDQLDACDFEYAVPGHQLPMTKTELMQELQDCIDRPDVLVLED